MIAVDFWGVKARKSPHYHHFAEPCRYGILALYAETICTILPSCVKFSTNKSFARPKP